MGKSILVIDIDTTFSQNVARLFAPFHVDVNFANSGSAGLTASDAGPDLIMLSAELPDTNGYMICKKLRGQENCGQAKIVITSTDDTPFQRHRQLDHRADDYLKKPISDEILVKKISTMLGTDEDFQGFQDEVSDVSFNRWVTGEPEIEPQKTADERNDGTAMDLLSRDELLAMIEGQERELAYLRKETSAFQSYMKHAEQTEKALKEAKRRLAENEKLLGSLDNSGDRLEEAGALKARLEEMEEENRRQLSALDLETRERAKAERASEVLKAELNKAFAELGAVQSEKERLEQETRQINEHIKEQNHAAQSNQEHLEALEDSNQSLKDQLDKARAQLHELQEERESRGQQEQEQERLIQKLEKLQNDLKQETTRGLETAEQLEQDLRETKEENAILSESLTRVRQELNESQETGRKHKEDLERANEKLATNNDAHQQSLRSLNQKIEEIQKDLEQERQSKTDLSFSLKSVQKENLDLQEQRAQLEEEIRKVSEQEQQRQADLDAERKQKNSATEKVTDLEGQIKARESMHQAQKAELQTKIESFSARLNQNKKEYDATISALNQEHAMEQERLLGEKNRIKSQHDLLDSQCHEQKITIENLEKKLADASTQHSSEVTRLTVTHEQAMKQVLQEKERDQTKSEEERQHLLHEKDQSIETLTSDRDALRIEVSRLEERLEEGEKERKRKREEAAQQIADLEHQRTTLAKNLQKEKEAREDVESRLETLDIQFRQASEDHENITRQQQEAFEQQLNDERNLLGEAKLKIEKMEEAAIRSKKLDEKFQDLSQELDKLKLGNQTLQNRLETARQTLESGLKELAGSTEELEFEED